MRYQCPDCLRWIKDKPFFGTFHICATPEEVKQAYQNSQWYRQQRLQAIRNLPPWLRY